MPSSLAEPATTSPAGRAAYAETTGPTPLALVTDGLVVPTVDGHHLTYANFDHAASTPALVTVERAVERASRAYSSVHRGNGWLSKVTTSAYEAARLEVGRYIGARPDDLVLFTRNTTDSMNLLAHALPDDVHVLVFRSEHHATLLPWDAARTHVLPIPRSQDEAARLLEEGLAATSHHPRRLLALTGATNVTGEVIDVARLAGLARSAGARVVLDAAQLAPHGPLDLARLGVDWVALSGHKLYAPYGAGVLAGPRDWLDAAEPYLVGGGASARVSSDGVAWHVGPARQEAGSPNVLGAVALAAACATLREHHEALEAHEEHIGRLLREGFAAIPGVHVLDVFSRDGRRAPIVTFTIAGVPSALAAAALSAEWGIGVRDGKFCAHQLVDVLLAEGGDPTGPATALRASGGLATRVEHVERLVEAVTSLALHGPRVEYVQDATGEWSPVEDHRDDEFPLPW